MNYKSTRDPIISVSSAQAITQGLSHEGGLFVPEKLPCLTEDDILSLCGKSYADKAFDILKLFLTDFTDEELRKCVKNAYGDNFDTKSITELKKLPEAYILELWHGPTCAFKDMALQILPRFMNVCAKKTIPGKRTAILVATSGDTGKAALEGFKDVDGTTITVFYPCDGVSDMQKRQMVTQEGQNVFVCGVKGNFDDCQNGVKAIFTDEEIAAELKDNNFVLSSANSINWGRLCPQIVYYICAYVTLIEENEIKYGEKINITVPTGNFGNILAAYYAKEMGLPVNKLICASNSNNVLTDFINTGIYDRNRKFYTTISPSMDILISSNLERLLYHLCGEDTKLVSQWFSSLAKDGRYEVTDEVKNKISESFWADFCSEEETKIAIKNCFEKNSYLIDTHTAVAYKVYNNYVKATGDNTKTVIASTANPYKFGAAVYGALGESCEGIDEFEIIERLEEKTGTKMPVPLAQTKNKKVRFGDVIEREAMPRAVKDFLEKVR